MASGASRLLDPRPNDTHRLYLSPVFKQPALAPPDSEAPDFVARHRRHGEANTSSGTCSFLGASDCHIEWDVWVLSLIHI